MGCGWLLNLAGLFLCASDVVYGFFCMGQAFLIGVC